MKKQFTLQALIALVVGLLAQRAMAWTSTTRFCRHQNSVVLTRRWADVPDESMKAPTGEEVEPPLFSDTSEDPELTALKQAIEATLGENGEPLAG